MVRRLMVFFALVYVAEGLGQVAGLINQPLHYFLMKSLGWQADQVTRYLAILTIPWVIKPIYGVVSDFIPLLGYRRKTYLFLSNLMAVGGYVWLMGLNAPGPIIIALFLVMLGMAISSTLCGAVMVENGQKTGLAGKFVNQQWLWFNIAAVGTSLVGGYLCQVLPPAGAMHIAALITAFAPVGVMLGCWFLIAEEKAQINIPQLKETTRGFISACKSKTLWVVAGFIFLYNFSPSFGTPLYYYMSNNLKFDQEFIGILSGLTALGSIAGSIIYFWLEKRMTLKHLLNLSIVLGAIAQGAYLWLGGRDSAIVLSLFNGVIAQIALVASLTLAAYACPKKAEGFSYALLMSVNNLATQLSMNIGAWMFVHWFGSLLRPLIYVSAGCTLIALLLVPVLKLGNQHAGDHSEDGK